MCSGFLYGLATGSQFILSGAHKSVLVIGADVFTRILDWQDRSTCVLFGDGAGAVVLQPTEQPGGLLSFVLGSDGSGACSLYVPAGGSRAPTSAETVADRAHYVKMQGRDVFRFATRVVPESVLQALEQAGPHHRRHRPVHPAPGQRADHRRNGAAAEAPGISGVFECRALREYVRGERACRVVRGHRRGPGARRVDGGAERVRGGPELGDCRLEVARVRG